MNIINDLNIKWEEHYKLYVEKEFKCEQCGESILGHNYNRHLWLKHFVWIFCRRAGIHWWFYKLTKGY